MVESDLLISQQMYLAELEDKCWIQDPKSWTVDGVHPQTGPGSIQAKRVHLAFVDECAFDATNDVLVIIANDDSRGPSLLSA